MRLTAPPLHANRLLKALPAAERGRIIEAGCRPITLAFAEVLTEPGERIRHV